VTVAAALPARENRPLASLRGLTKRYGGIEALAGVDINLYAGVVHAVCGENGAGKSTLMKILAGAETRDSGTIEFVGSPVRHHSVSEANADGIAIVFQEMSLFPDLDVLANLFIMREPVRGPFVDRAEMARRARAVLDELGLGVDVGRPVGSLRLADQQLVEIAKALLADARLLILDEPNSALNASESERLFAIVRTLRARGVAILFVSHRLEEVFALADVITVMRNGKVVREVATADTDISAIVADMVGERRLQPHRRRASPAAADAGTQGLIVDSVTVEGEVSDLTFTAAPGDVIGLAGLEGSGTTAILDALFGLKPLASGRVTLPGGAPAPASPQAAVKAGVALVPADRRTEGLSLAEEIGANISTVTAGVLGRFGRVLDQAAMDRAAAARADALNLVRRSLRQPARSLSGGNQQKVVLAKWLGTDPDVILLNDPTRGIDVGAKAEIYRIIEMQADAGRVVLFHSTELPEFALLCDRVLVFYRGRMVGALPGADATPRALLEAINVGRVQGSGRMPA
jgi:ABC-type sugar transport system ATPase subunit